MDSTGQEPGHQAGKGVYVNEGREENHSLTPGPTPQSQGAITAIIVVFSILGVLIVVVLLFLLVRKLQEKRQTEGTYRPSSEEQVGARAPPPPNLKLPPEERLI